MLHPVLAQLGTGESLLGNGLAVHSEIELALDLGGVNVGVDEQALDHDVVAALGDALQPEVVPVLGIAGGACAVGVLLCIGPGLGIAAGAADAGLLGPIDLHPVLGLGGAGLAVGEEVGLRSRGGEGLDELRALVDLDLGEALAALPGGDGDAQGHLVGAELHRGDLGLAEGSGLLGGGIGL